MPTVIASTAGLATTPPPWIDAGHDILCAYDADRAGDQAARRLQRRHARVRPLRPQSGKDWNDMLVAKGGEPALAR